MSRERLAYRLAALSAVAILIAAVPSVAAAATTETTTFTTPGSSSFTVPVGVTSLEVTAIGARGGRGCFASGAGGEGARITGAVPVSGGQSIAVEVGGVGGDLGGCQATVPWPGGVGGGGNGGVEGGGAGGGASLVSLGSFTPGFSSPLLVAGAGGGEGNEEAAGGNAGAPGTASSGAGGGGAGTETQGGSAGVPGCSGGVFGSPGTLAVGGNGGSIYTGGVSTGGGGGGGGGYYGGGGGAACPAPFNNEGGSGGGGGGGSSFAAPSVTGISGPTPTTSPASVSITYGAPLAALGGSGLSNGGYRFPSQPQGTLSAAELLTVSNEGSAPVVVSGLSLSGANPDDYLLNNRCQKPVPATAGSNSCQIAVRFSPQAEGASAARLTIASNSIGGDLSVALSGTGGQLPQGPAGKVELVTCKKVKKKAKGKGKAARRGKTRRRCKAKLVSGPVIFKTATAARAPSSSADLR